MFRNKIFGSEGGEKIFKRRFDVLYYKDGVSPRKIIQKNLDIKKRGNEREFCYKKICFFF